jgi:hypothetical protein
VGPAAVDPATAGSRAGLRIAYIILAAAAVVAAIGIAAPGPRRVNIRWSASTTPAQRFAAEQTIGLERPRRLEAGTWSYEVQDAAMIQRILQQPAVDDTHYIDRDRRTLSPELPRGRARVRQLYEATVPAAIVMHWRMFAGALLIVGLALAWSRLRWTYRTFPERVWLAAILVVSLAARMALVLAGGQHYWPDEGRYTEAAQMVESLAARDIDSAWSRAMTSGHPLFKTVAMAPAAFEAQYGRDPRIPATFFAMFSVLNIWLLARIARRLGATPLEGVWVALLAAASTSWLFYARHLFPYDLAITFALLALYAGTARERRWRHSVVCGVCAACAFLTYYGAWTLGAAVCAVHVFDAPSWKQRCGRGLLALAGLGVPMSVAVGVSELTGEDFLLRLRTFADTVTQGSFEEGWRVPFEYLWQTERFLLILWLGSVAWCLATWRSWRTVRAVRTGLIGLACLYCTLAVLSTWIPFLVVYGRVSRQLVPFLCLVAAPVLVRMFADTSRFRRPALTAIAVLVVAQAVFNARPVFSQWFPLEFVSEGEQLAGRLGASRVEEIYARHLYPPAKVDPPPGYVDVLAARHPLQFGPYQYDGFVPDERRFLRSTDIRMRILIPGTERPR